MIFFQVFGLCITAALPSQRGCIFFSLLEALLQADFLFHGMNRTSIPVHVFLCAMVADVITHGTNHHLAMEVN
jgi:hypothetical protein